MKAWLKGGLIAFIIFIILRLTFGNSFLGIPLVIFSVGIFTGIGALVNFIIPLIIFFLIGALIGWIIGKIKSKKNADISSTPQ